MANPKIDLRPKFLDLELYAGDGVTIQLTVTDNAVAAIDLDGAITAQIRAARLDVEVLAAFSADLTGAADGIVLVSLTGEQTADLITDDELFTGAWDVQWVKVGSEPITLVQGKVKCHADVTR